MMRNEFKIRRLPHGGYIVSGVEPYDVDAEQQQLRQWIMLAAFNDLSSTLAYLREHMISDEASKAETA